MAANTKDKIIEAFSHPTIHPIVRQPTYELIAEVYLKLNINAASVHLHRGNGQLDLLFLIVQPEVYNTLSTTLFLLPTNSGQNLTILEGVLGLQISDIRCRH